MFGPTNRFKPRVRVEFMQDVLDMIIYRGKADMQLVGDAPGRTAFCKKAKNLNLSGAEISLTRRRA